MKVCKVVQNKMGYLICYTIKAKFTKWILSLDGENLSVVIYYKKRQRQ